MNTTQKGRLAVGCATTSYILYGVSLTSIWLNTNNEPSAVSHWLMPMIVTTEIIAGILLFVGNTKETYEKWLTLQMAVIFCMFLSDQLKVHIDLQCIIWLIAAILMLIIAYTKVFAEKQKEA